MIGLLVIVLIAGIGSSITLNLQHDRRIEQRQKRVAAQHKVEQAKRDKAAKAKQAIIDARRTRVQDYINQVAPRFELFLTMIQTSNKYIDEYNKSSTGGDYASKTNKLLEKFTNPFNKMRSLNPSDPEIQPIHALLITSLASYMDEIEPGSTATQADNAKSANVMRDWHSRLVRLAKSSGADMSAIEKSIAKHRKKIAVF